MGSRDLLTAQVDSLDGVCRIALSGELDMSSVVLLDDHLTRSADDDVIAIVLDLRGLTFVDTAGLHAIVEARDRANTRGHRLSLVGASRATRRLIELTGTEYLLDDRDPDGVPDRSTPPPSDPDLMDRIARGDANAFADLFDRYAPTAMAVARRILGHGHLAEDVVQEGFLAVWRTPEAYRSERGTVRAWLLAIVHHRAVDLVRREESQRARSAQVAASGAVNERPPDPGDVVVGEAGLAEDRRRVRTALAALPPAQQQVIELMYFGGLSQSRIAEHLSVPLGTVKSRTRLGMRSLHEALGPMER